MGIEQADEDVLKINVTPSNSKQIQWIVEYM